jgi:hypothetical protein
MRSAKVLPVAFFRHEDYLLTDRPRHAAFSDLGFDQVSDLFVALHFRAPSIFVTRRPLP